MAKRDWIGESPLERDLSPPVDAPISRDAATAHAACMIEGLSGSHQGLLWVAAAERAGAAERTMIDHRNRAAGLARPRARHLRGGTGPDDDEVDLIHGITARPRKRRRSN
jgi:hypothetical protein